MRGRQRGADRCQRMRSLVAALLVLPVWAGWAAAQAAPQDRFWILWERISSGGTPCPEGGICPQTHSYSSRPLATSNTGFIYRLFGLNDGGGPTVPLPEDHPEGPNLCHKSRAAQAMNFDPDTLPRSVKGEVLRGIRALHLDLTKLKPPPGFDDSFGPDMHEAFADVLSQAGIQVVARDQVHRLAGQPTLNLYFSFSDPEALCEYEYSVFASLSQEVLLARDVRIKVAAGVWSYSTGSAAPDHSGTEADAILRVAQAFVRDHRLVNAR